MSTSAGSTNDTYQSSPATGDLLMIDALHQYAYCLRRMPLMHVDGLMAHNAFTEDGKWVHRRVDAADDVLPIAEGVGDDPPDVLRSVSLTDDGLGLTGKLDLCEISAGEAKPAVMDDLTGAVALPIDAPLAVPVETKRGKVPNNPERSWEPERVQLMAQGFLLRAHGYRVWDNGTGSS